MEAAHVLRIEHAAVPGVECLKITVQLTGEHQITGSGGHATNHKFVGVIFPDLFSDRDIESSQPASRIVPRSRLRLTAKEEDTFSSGLFGVG
jgi:hypothetical protein